MSRYLYYYEHEDDREGRARLPWWAPAVRWFNAAGGDILIVCSLLTAVVMFCTKPMAE